MKEIREEFLKIRGGIYKTNRDVTTTPYQAVIDLLDRIIQKNPREFERW